LTKRTGNRIITTAARIWRLFFLEKFYTKVALGGYYYVKVERVRTLSRIRAH
jgi:hypothetical protein